jgi:hypothetical protein
LWTSGGQFRDERSHNIPLSTSEDVKEGNFSMQLSILGPEKSSEDPIHCPLVLILEIQITHCSGLNFNRKATPFLFRALKQHRTS